MTHWRHCEDTVQNTKWHMTCILEMSIYYIWHIQMWKYLSKVHTSMTMKDATCQSSTSHNQDEYIAWLVYSDSLEKLKKKLLNSFLFPCHNRYIYHTEPQNFCSWICEGLSLLHLFWHCESEPLLPPQNNWESLRIKSGELYKVGFQALHPELKTTVTLLKTLTVDSMLCSIRHHLYCATHVT